MIDKEIFTKVKITNIVIGCLFLVVIAFFFYGLINNIQAKKDKELAQQTMVRLKECEQKAEELTKHMTVLNAQLMQALEEAKTAKDFALQQAKAATESIRKK
jgi:F0F1-type ATP synthase membrane subunit b/b'